MTTTEAEPSSREALIEAARAGAVTLVLGAGVSIGAGVPNWRGLAIRVWQQALKTPGDPSAIDHLEIEKVVQDPQLLPIIFELAAERLGVDLLLKSCVDVSMRPRPSSTSSAPTKHLTRSRVSSCVTTSSGLAGVSLAS